MIGHPWMSSVTGRSVDVVFQAEVVPCPTRQVEVAQMLQAKQVPQAGSGDGRVPQVQGFQLARRRHVAEPLVGDKGGIQGEPPHSRRIWDTYLVTRSPTSVLLKLRDFKPGKPVRISTSLSVTAR